LYRDNGAIGALLDEYEKALNELKALVSTLTVDELTRIVDHDTKDKDCRSIQTVLSHVVGAGCHYVEAIRMHYGEVIDYYKTEQYNTVPEYLLAIDRMLSWGQRYDVEQLFEHAIVHVLRHRRQVERFLLKLRINT